jgi:uncharacterized membrane protein
MKKHKTPYASISYRSLGILLSILVIIAASSPFIFSYLTEKSKQKDCVNGFYFFENSDFSTCYPKDMMVEQPDSMIPSSNGKYTYILTITNGERAYTFDPNSTSAGGLDHCTKKESIVINGKKAERYIHKKIHNDTCGVINFVSTRIKQNSGLMFQMEQNEPADIDEYKIVESSLRLK